jgi:hypothetical protein
VRELTDKSALDPSLSGDVLTRGNDNRSPYRTIIETAGQFAEILLAVEGR